MEFEDFVDHVDLFNNTFATPRDPDHNLRGMLVVEEVGELWTAIVKNKSKEEIAGEWADSMYVLVGWGLHLGIDMKEAFYQVCLKNQKKIDNRANLKISASGKVLKAEDTTAVPAISPRPVTVGSVAEAKGLILHKLFGGDPEC